MMKVARIVRWRINNKGEAFKFKTRFDCWLNLTGELVDVFGPKYGFEVRGLLLPNLRGNYPGADYHLCLEVMAETNSNTRASVWERWYITFNPIGEDA